MIWRDVIELGQGVESISHGESVLTFTWTTVFANKRSVRQSEFYQAADAGLKPELVFEVRTVDFNNHERIKFDNKTYTITRVENRGDNTFLTVSSYVGSDL